MVPTSEGFAHKSCRQAQSVYTAGHSHPDRKEAFPYLGLGLLSFTRIWAATDPQKGLSAWSLSPGGPAWWWSQGYIEQIQVRTNPGAHRWGSEQRPPEGRTQALCPVPAGILLKNRSVHLHTDSKRLQRPAELSGWCCQATGRHSGTSGGLSDVPRDLCKEWDGTLASPYTQSHRPHWRNRRWSVGVPRSAESPSPLWPQTVPHFLNRFTQALGSDLTTSEMVIFPDKREL